jgi:hypothetical protein
VFLQDCFSTADPGSKSTSTMRRTGFFRSGQEIGVFVAGTLLRLDLLFASSLAGTNVVPYAEAGDIVGAL